MPPHAVMEITDTPDESLPFSRLPLQQSPAYGATLGLLGAAVRRLTARAGGAPIGQALIVARRIGPLRLSVVSRGPQWLGDGTDVSTADFLRIAARGAGILAATPETPVAGGGLVPLFPPRRIALVPLWPDPAVMRAGLRPKWRRRLQQAEAAGLTLRRHGAAADPRWLLAADRAAQRASGYRALPPAFTLAWQAADPQALRIYSVQRGGQCVAAAAFLLHRPWASYHIAWAAPEGRDTDAPRLLLWRAMADLGAEGYTMLDLGIEGPPGLAAFKRGTGADLETLGQTALILPSRCPRRGGSPGAWPAIRPRADGI